MQKGAPKEWIAGHLDRVARYLDWNIEHRSSKNGLLVWEIEGDANCRSGESGLDNSPRFDAATPMEAVDFSAFMSLEYELLALLAEACGQSQYIEPARAHHQKLNSLINERLWSVERGCYLDYDLAENAQSTVVAVTTFLPLICGAAEASQVESLAKLVGDEDVFGTQIPFPSIARNDPTYKLDMWCGPVWINLAWVAIVGFARYGHTELSESLARRLCRGVEDNFQKYGCLFEFFDPDNRVPPFELERKGKCAPEESPYFQVVHDFGWTAALYLDLRLGEAARLPDVS